MALLNPRFPCLQRLGHCKPRHGAACVPRTNAPQQPACRSRSVGLCALPGKTDLDAVAPLGHALRAGVAGLLASGLLWLTPAPANADIQTVSPQVVTQMARPLPKQTVDKGKVWTIFIGGAVALFASTLVLENNPQIFPAITRANQAMKMTAQQMQEQEELEAKQQELLRLRQQEFDEEQRRLAAVQQGLRDAKAKLKAAQAASPDQAAPQAAAATAVAATAATAAVAAAPPAAAPLPSLDGGSPAASGRSAEEGTAEPQPQPQLAVASSAASAHADASTSSADAGGGGAAAAAAAAPSYVVVEDAVPDLGQVAWPATPPAGEDSSSAVPHAPGASGSDSGPAAVGVAAAGAAAPAATPAAVAAAPVSVGREEDAESMARLARLQGFVSGTMVGSKGPLEALRSQRQ